MIIYKMTENNQLQSSLMSGKKNPLTTNAQSGTMCYTMEALPTSAAGGDAVICAQGANVSSQSIVFNAD